MSSKSEKKAKSAGVYDRVGSMGGTLVIGGAEKRWKEDETFCYIPGERIAAPLVEMKKFLKENHKDEMKNLLKSAFYPENIEANKAVKEAFHREVENAEEERRCQNQDRKKKLQLNLELVVKLDKLMRQQKRDQKDVKATTKTSGSKRHSDLKSKVKDMKTEGKVLYVTNMDAEGKKCKKETWKAGPNRRRLSNDKSDRFYNVVYNPQSEKSPEGVGNFLKQHGGFDSSQIETVVNTIEEGNRPNFSRGRSPTRSPHLSPKNTRKASGKKTSGKKASGKKTSGKKASGKKKVDSDDEVEDFDEDEDLSVFKGMDDSEEDDFEEE